MKIMKKAKFALLTIVLSLMFLTPTSAGDCYICDNATTDECLRVISGNGVHIYYGNKKPCDPDE